MTRDTPRRKRAAPASTGERLLLAAIDEFRRAGFDGTDTNRIARRAGFAPQTFYRWYDDKTAVFLAAYRRWQDEELQLLGPLLDAGVPTGELSDTIVAHHRRHLRFRRSLRQLAIENPAVRRARAEARKLQIERMRLRAGKSESARGAIAATLLQVERLADGIAEGEFDDLGSGTAEARAILGQLVGQLLGSDQP